MVYVPLASQLLPFSAVRCRAVVSDCTRQSNICTFWCIFSIHREKHDYGMKEIIHNFILSKGLHPSETIKYQ